MTNVTTRPSLAVVIASNREASIQRWLYAWKNILKDVPVYIVEDNHTHTFNILKERHGYTNLQHFSWTSISADLGDSSWIIPRHTSAIKSYGFWKAKKDSHDFIWTLDDDCLPETGSGAPWNYPQQMIQALSTKHPEDSWYNTMDSCNDLYPRGYPYGVRQAQQVTAIHHGLWSGVPDLDGITALEHHEFRTQPYHTVERIPTGKLFPMCGMNLAFRSEFIPAMYFGLQGSTLHPATVSIVPEKLPFDRFDDIWAGLFAKKIADHLGYAVTTGAPSILHTKESDPVQRVIKEGPGIAAHEALWRTVKHANLGANSLSPVTAYKSLAHSVDCAANDLPFPYYWHDLADAMRIWAELFS